jgi:3-oxoacyl-[acyl-carrier protein] reductase
VDLKIKGKRAIVFGSSSGLGKAIAETLVKEGARVVVASRNAEGLQKTKNEIGAAMALTCDSKVPGSTKKLVEHVVKEWGGVDIVVCNTGGPPKGPFEELSTNQWNEGVQSLWLAVIEALRASLPSMREQKWGRILLVTSAAAKEPIPLLTVSNGLRAGLLGLANSLSQEYGPHGITVNALLPGYTRTERLKELNVAEEKMTSQIPARRLGEPWELGALAAFLASDLAGYITGQAIACDGGYLHGI